MADRPQEVEIRLTPSEIAILLDTIKRSDHIASSQGLTRLPKSLRMVQEKLTRRRKFKVGDRALMLRHEDWKGNAPGAIADMGPLKELPDGSFDYEYTIIFDAPHLGTTGGKNPVECTYEASKVLEQYRRLTDARKKRSAGGHLRRRRRAR